jgi:hypothetical protein
MGWFGRRKAVQRSRVDSEFDAEGALHAFVAARTVSERFAALQPEMLTVAYDIWMGGYLERLWLHDRDTAEWAEKSRFVLRYCYEVGATEALPEVDVVFPDVWQRRLESGGTENGSLERSFESR